MKNANTLNKYIVSLILFFVSYSLCGQVPYPAKSPRGGISTLDSTVGAITSATGFINKPYTDTTAANSNPNFKYYTGAQIYTTSDMSFWLRQGSKWIKMNGGSAPTPTCMGLESGGIVTWASGLTFDVSAATYGIMGTCYSSAQGSITLNTADPSLPRLDVIGLDNTGAIIKITGVPSATPASPQINPNTQLYLTTILVPAGSTVPSGVSSNVIWDENTGTPEYTGSTDGTANFNNTVFPYHLSKSTDFGAFASSKKLFYTGIDYPLSGINTIKFWVKLKAAFSSTAQISIELSYNGVPITVPYLLTTELNKSNTTSYQNISIPLSSLNFYGSATTVNGIKFIFDGANASGVYIDYITFNGGVSNETSPFIMDVYQKNGTDSLFKVRNGISYFVGLMGGSGGGSDTTVAKFPLYVKSTGGQKDSLGVYHVDSSFFSAVRVGDSIRYSRWNGETVTIFSPAGDYIPLSGTEVGKPVTGQIELRNAGSKGLFAIETDEDDNPTDGFFNVYVSKDQSSINYQSDALGTILKSLAVSKTNPDVAFYVSDNTPSSRGFAGSQDFTPNITDLDYTQKKYVTRVADSLKATIATKGNGTVTNFSKTDGYGITSSVTNPTTTPNHTVAVDTTTLFPAVRATIASGGGGGTPDSSWITGEFGTPFPVVGTIINTGLGALPSGWAQTNPVTTMTFTGTKLQVSGTPNNNANFLTADYYNYDKVSVQTLFVPQNKTSTSYGLTYTFAANALFFSNSLVVSLNLTSTADSGRIYIGASQSNPFSISVGDSCMFGLSREGWETTAWILNKTKGTLNKLNVTTGGWGTGGKLQLTFNGGNQDILSFKAFSWSKKNPEWLVFGDSHSAAAGATSQEKGYAYRLFNNQSSFDNISNGSLTMDYAANSHLPAIINIAPKNIILALGYNDRRDLVSDTNAYRQRLDTLVFRLQRALPGVNIILPNLVPTAGASQLFDSTIRNLSVTRSAQLIDIRSKLLYPGSTSARSNLLAADNIHMSDSGHAIYANAILNEVVKIQKGFEKDTTSFLFAYDLPKGNSNMDLIVQDQKGGIYKIPNRKYNTIENAFNFNGQGTSAQASSEIHLSGPVKSDSALFINGQQGLYINFNGGKSSKEAGTSGSNVLISNAGSAGIGTPQSQNTITGLRNIWFNVNSSKSNMSGSITGNDNQLYKTNIQTGGSLTGSSNVFINNATNVNTYSGSRNIHIGLDALSGMGSATGSDNIIISNQQNGNGGGSTSSTITGAILIGTWQNYNGFLPPANGEVVIAANTGGQKIYTFGQLGAVNGATILRASVRAGVNQVGNLTTVTGETGTGTGGSGAYEIVTYDPASSGSAVNTTKNVELTVTKDLVKLDANLNLNTIGNKLNIATGTNASVGTATLVAGTVTVNTTAVLTGSKIFVSVRTAGGVQGFLSVPTASVTNATSFIINSSSPTDTSTIDYWIIN